MRTALLIARKDLVQRVRDKSVFIYGVVAPLGLALLFSTIFGPIAEAFMEMLDSIEDDGFATIVEVDSAEEAEEWVERGSDQFATDDTDKASAAFVLPAGLSDQVTAGQGGEITVIGSAGTQLSSQVAYSIAQAFSTEVGAVEVAVRTALEYTAPPDGPPYGGAVERITADAATSPLPVSLTDVTAATRQLPQTSYLAAGMAVFFLFFTVSFGVSGLLGERRTGTLDRLLAAPIDRRQIIAGKAITSFVLGIVSMTIIFVATSLLLGAEWGDPLGVALLVVSVVISAMGVLGVVAATARTQAQAENFQAIISLVLAFLGGTFFSVSQAGGVVEVLSYFTPHAWFLRGLSDLQGGDIASVYPSVAALIAFGVVTGGIAWPFMRRAVER